jgi:hypothetical protein
MQHDLFSWEVDRDQFVYLDEVDEHSRFVDHTLKTWLTQVSPEQREQFVDALFSILEETNASSLKELTANWHKNAIIVLKSIRSMDDEMRHNISQALRLLFEAAKQTVRGSIQRNAPKPKFLQQRRPQKK